MSAFGQVLKDIRGTLGLSQLALANTLNSTQRHVSFLETGRSRPTPVFLSRICRDLELNIAQRVNLYEASGLRSPYLRRDLRSDDITAALNLIESRVLRNWPFPALVLDPDWTILRSNVAFERMFSPFLTSGNAAPNLLEIMVSDPFRTMISNWDQVAGVFYYRLQRSSNHSAHVADVFTKARARGLFAAVEQDLTSDDGIPVFVPIRLTLPNGAVLEISSFLGQLASCQDALIEGLEIELIVPLDETSEQIMRAMA